MQHAEDEAGVSSHGAEMPANGPYSREEDGPSKASYYGLVVSTDDADGAVDGTRSPGLAAHMKLMLYGGDFMVNRDVS